MKPGVYPAYWVNIAFLYYCSSNSLLGEVYRRGSDGSSEDNHDLGMTFVIHYLVSPISVTEASQPRLIRYTTAAYTLV
jgi:hypothetical protein